MNSDYAGSCLCGGVGFRAGGFSPQVGACHCTMCRKFHGAPIGVLVGVERIEWLKGEQLLKEYTAENGTVRTFCSRCGSSLGFRTAGTPRSKIEIAIACFDEDIPVVIDAHIFTDNKACWYEPDSNLPQYGQARGTTSIQN